MGVVTDPSNAAVPDANVEILDEVKGVIQQTKTDREGVYRFYFLVPSRYALKVWRDGFREESRTVNVLLGPPVTVNVALAIAKGSTTVQVKGDAPLIQAENGDAAATMTERQISEVPNPGNDLTYIAQTAPGVIMNTDFQFGTNFSMLGMPGTSYHFTLDGIDISYVTDPLDLVLGQNQIQEATVVSHGYSGQFGNAAGGNITYVSKSGGNTFHGNAQYFWNGTPLNANQWILNAFGKPRTFDNANQWAGSLGGAIKKEKLFFFFDSEGLRLVLAPVTPVQLPSPQFETATLANIDTAVDAQGRLRFGPGSATDAFYRKIFNVYNAAPGASAALPGGFSVADPTGCTGFQGLGSGVPCAIHYLTAPRGFSSDTLTAGRIDWNVGKNDRVFLRLQYEIGSGAFAVDPISPLLDGYLNGQWWQGQVVETHAFGSSSASQFLAAVSYVPGSFKVRNVAQTLSLFPTNINFFAAGSTFNNLGGGQNGSVPGSRWYLTNFQLTEDVAKTKGKQKFGFGASFARNNSTNSPNANNQVGQLNPQTLDAFYQGGIDPASPTTDYTTLMQSFTAQGSLPVSYYYLALYGQDEWHMRTNFSLTVALRAEHYSNPICRNGCFARLAGPFESVNHDPAQPYNEAIQINQKHALEKTDTILWSPRVSFAWQPFGVSHGSVLRGGVGIFYDSLNSSVPSSFTANAPEYNSYTVVGDNLAPNETTSLFKNATASNQAFMNGFASGQTVAQLLATIPSFAPPAFNAAAQKMHSPQYHRWSLEWQQAFGADTSVNVGYFGHHGIHGLVQNPNANAFGFGSLPARPCATPPVAPCYDSRFSEVLEFNSNAVSNYHGMVVSLKHQLSRWTQGTLQANYTFGHAFDETSNGGLFTFGQGGSIFPQDANNLRDAYGPAEYDVRHSLNASYVWDVPLKEALRGHGPESLLRGWQISGTLFARTGLPYTLFDNTESANLRQNNYFGELYAVPAVPIPTAANCGAGAVIPAAPHPCFPPQFFVLTDGTTEPNSEAEFLQSGCETGFNTGKLPGPSGPCGGLPVSFAQGRNRFRGRSYFSTDLGIMKNTRIPRWENASLGIGVQFYNLLNHPNFGFPDNWSSDSTFGQIFYLEQPPTTVLGSGLAGDASPRMIQLKAQLRF